ncbi:hypothetical protein BH11PSE9_BH11PSE9_25650 [soil metagenome]
MPSTALSRQPASATDRLRTMSRWMRALIAFGAVFVLAAPFGLALADTDSVQGYVSNLAAESLRGSAVTFPPALRGWALALALPVVALGLFALLQAWHLFGAYGRGVVFGPQASVRLRTLGRCFIAAAVLRPATHTALVLLLTWHNPPGQRQLILAVSSDDYLCLLFGGLLLAMSWAMAEASRIEQENAGFI